MRHPFHRKIDPYFNISVQLLSGDMRANSNKAKQDRGEMIIDLVEKYGIPEMTRRRNSRTVKNLDKLWRKVVVEVNREFSQLPALTVESVKNKCRHYRRPRSQ